MKNVVLATAAMACFAVAASANASFLSNVDGKDLEKRVDADDSRSEVTQFYLGDIGREATRHSYNHLSLSYLTEDVDHLGNDGLKSSGFEVSGSWMFGKYGYLMGKVATLDDDGMDAQRIGVGIGFAADTGMKRTNTDVFGEAWVTHYDVSQEVNGLVNEDDGFMVEARFGVRTNWGVNRLDSRLYVGMVDSTGYSGDSEVGGYGGLIGASLGYHVMPSVMVGASIEAFSSSDDNNTWKEEGRFSHDETVATRLTLSYQF